MVAKLLPDTLIAPLAAKLPAAGAYSASHFRRGNMVVARTG
ncbi:MAG: hypothetical protein ACRCZF_17305 [Gemmataceae bacterium]